MSQITVEVLDQKISLADLVVENLPDIVFQWESGGITDPIGQLIGWLWSQISGAFDLLKSAIRSMIGGVETLINSVRSTITSAIDAVKTSVSGLGTLISGISTAINNIYTGIVNTITTALGGISRTLQGFSTWFSSLASSIASLASQILTGITSAFGTLRTWLSSAVAGLQTAVSSMAGMITTISSAIGTGFSSLLGSLSKAISGLGSSILTALSSLGKQVWDGILGFKEWLVSGLATIGTAIGGLGTAISTFVSSIPKTLSDFWAWIEGGWNKFAEGVGNLWNQAVKWMTDTVAEAKRMTGEVHTTLMGFFNPLIGIGEALKNLANSAIAFFKDPWGTIKETLGKAFEPILKPLQGLWDTLVKMGSAIVDFFKDPWTAIKKTFEPILKPIQEALVGLRDKFLPLAKAITEFFQDPIKSLKDIFNEMWNLVYPFIEGGIKWVQEKAKPMLDQIWNTLKDAGTWLTTKIQEAFNWAWEGLKTIGGVVGKVIVSSITTFVNLGTSLVTGVKNLIMNLYLTVVNATGKMTTGFFQELSKRILKGEAKGEWIEMAGFVGVIASTQFVFRWASNVLWWLGEMSKEVDINLDAVLEPLGLGIGGDIGYKMNLGWILKHMAIELQKYPDELARAMIYGVAIWLSQPFGKLMSSTARNYIPVQLPQLHELVEMTRRSLPTADLPRVIGYTVGAMALWGYADTVVELATKSPEGDWKVDIVDRFGKTRALPRSLVYDLPSATDMARMMVRDIFGTPENPFPSFAKAIAMRGMTEDVAKMYYLLHFRYPTMENLWEFTVRCASGMAWIPDAPNLEQDLGASGGKAPIALNQAKVALGTLKSFITDFLSKYIKPYAKWHDYAPFPWVEGFTGDRLIMLDLMARLPDKIDARWMWRWSIVDDTDLMRMVVAGGYHPDWVEAVTVAEAMNAMTEERSYVRIGVLNAYEQGFMASTKVDEIFKNITTIPILGKERVVKFLEGERKLLIIRHTWDRALNVLNSLWRNLTLGFQRSMITDSKMLDTIKSTVTDISEIVGVDLATDEKFLSAWIDSLAVRRDFETVQRIRYWMRIFIYRATQLAESGEAYEDIVRKYANVAMLTQTETQIMLDLGKAFIDAYRRGKKLIIIKNYVKGKLKSGNMTLDVAIDTLVKAGMDKQDAIAWLEAEVKPRVVSVDKLISMKKLIPIQLELLKKKMTAEGVPPDEQALYLPYAVAQELSTAIGKEATEIINDYVKGITTDQVLTGELDNLATLDGTVKASLGVDWIVLSPEERKLLISIAKRRKARAMTPTLPEEGKPKLLTTDKIISLQELIPVASAKLQEAMTRERIPPDEQKMYLAYAVASELKDEMGRIVTDLISDFAKRLLTDAQYKKALDDLATLNDQVPTILGIPWIVYSPQERQMLYAVGVLRRARTKPAT